MTLHLPLHSFVTPPPQSPESVAAERVAALAHDAMIAASHEQAAARGTKKQFRAALERARKANEQ